MLGFLRFYTMTTASRALISRTSTRLVGCLRFTFMIQYGIQLEFAGWVRNMNTETDATHEPATVSDKERYLKMQESAAEQMAKFAEQAAAGK